MTATAGRRAFFKALLIVAAALLFTAWLRLTPDGILGKADAIGYSVCHRISVRSFFIGERQFPICARCSGMYLGALAGLLYHLRGPRKTGMPSRKLMIIFGLFLLIFAVDGINSYLHLLPGFAGLYQPTNFLRLLTGTMLGLGMAAVLVPVVRQTLWSDALPGPALHSWRQLGELLLIAALVDAAVLSNNPLLLFPLALAGAGTILAMLALIYAVLWAMLAHKENQYRTWRGLWVLLLAGFITAILQIAVMDAGRYWLTGTWEGFHVG